MDENELMGSLAVPKAVAQMAVPSVISSLVTVVYNMADTFFVGQTGDPLQVAAVSLTNPIFILMMAFANMFGMGGSAVLSMAMGEKNEARVRQASSFVTYASLLVGVMFAVILIVFMDPILAVFGANAETYDFARGYTLHIAWGYHDSGTGDGGSCHCHQHRKYHGQRVLSLVLFEEKPGALHPPFGFYMERTDFFPDLFCGAPHRHIFRSDERVHDCPESDAGGLWKCAGGGHWNCI